MDNINFTGRRVGPWWLVSATNPKTGKTATVEAHTLIEALTITYHKLEEEDFQPRRPKGTAGAPIKTH